MEKQKKNETVLKFRAKRHPTVAGLPRDFAQTRRDDAERIRAEIQRASRDNARADRLGVCVGHGMDGGHVRVYLSIDGGRSMKHEKLHDAIEAQGGRAYVASVITRPHAGPYFALRERSQ
jgi:hypothetical protein